MNSPAQPSSRKVLRVDFETGVQKIRAADAGEKVQYMRNQELSGPWSLTTGWRMLFDGNSVVIVDPASQKTDACFSEAICHDNSEGGLSHP